MELFNIHNLSQFLGEKELFSIQHLTIQNTDRIALIGENGCGKSTLLKLLAGKPKSAAITQNKGIEIGYLPQQPQRSRLSGGQEVKKELEELFCQDKGFLLLDEPTSCLDQGNISWLIDQLLKFRGGFIVVSHDRFFMNAIAKQIFCIENRKITNFGGTYSEFEYYQEQTRDRLILLNKEYEKKVKKIEVEIKKRKQKAETMVKKKKSVSASDWKVNARLGKYDRHQKSMDSSANALQKRLAKMEKPEKFTLPKQFVFRYDKDFDLKKNTLIRLEEADFCPFNQKLFHYPELKIKFGEHILLGGANGSGKSSFLNALSQLQLPTISFTSKKLSIGLFTQNSRDLDLDKTMLQNILPYSNQQNDFVIDLLSGLGFLKADFQKPVKRFSGGERTRIGLAKVLLQNHTLLLLDEPTNFLDIKTIKVFEKFLLHYPGSIILVSHDVHLAKRCQMKSWTIQNQKLTDIEKPKVCAPNTSLSNLLMQRDLLLQNSEIPMEEIEKLDKQIEKIQK